MIALGLASETVDSANLGPAVRESGSCPWGCGIAKPILPYPQFPKVRNRHPRLNTIAFKIVATRRSFGCCALPPEPRKAWLGWDPVLIMALTKVRSYGEKKLGVRLVGAIV